MEFPFHANNKTKHLIMLGQFKTEIDYQVNN